MHFIFQSQSMPLAGLRLRQLRCTKINRQAKACLLILVSSIGLDPTLNSYKKYLKKMLDPACQELHRNRL